MFKISSVLQWPYEDLPVMDPSDSFDVSKLPKMQFEYLSSPTEHRKPFDHNKSKSFLSSQVGLYKSAVDRTKGYNAESELVYKLQDMGLNCYELSHYKDNYIRHIDLEVSAESASALTIDVESPKALRKSRAGYSDPLSVPQNRFVCLQLGPSSTLFGGQADYLAFGLTTGQFVFARRNDLVKTIKEKMSDFLDGSKQYRSAWPETALWVPYVRTYEGHHTIMTYMDLNDLPLIGYV